MTIQEIREAAAQLLEQGWTQGYYARDAKGEECSPTSDTAVRWCFNGALIAVAGGKSGFGVRHAIRARAAAESGIGNSIGFWNDAPSRTQAEVVAAMRGQPKAEA
jgi:hypothetical protein